ncbi:hypothetical protein GCK72_024420 [Caenorhabditis remanei]|uniref:DUF38 domain-containing protein n=1 Tax=Caenorhabditis remanei TaxID=31234 RepID=A0A6A5FZV0_CAERE|nr:hypothetical protein GCK72_024420 [Caenorhabditis remanei]KAF1747954.1 hypothetical protein GCK72_024420 [Caenorhabditis remanei]
MAGCSTLTAKYLKQIVDARDTMINRVHIHWCSQTVGIEVHEVTKEKPETFSFNVSVIPGVNHIDNAVKKFEKIISKPNNKINHLKIDWVHSEENRASYDELLKSLAVSLADFVEKVHVEELTIDVIVVEHLEYLLRSLKPDILKRLFALLASQQRIDHEITISHDMENTKQMLEPYIDCSRLTTCRGYYIRSNEKRLTFELTPNYIIFSTIFQNS